MKESEGRRVEKIEGRKNVERRKKKGGREDR
jgi:hypothetical protein